MNDQPTVVIFRKCVNGDIIAIFPENPGFYFKGSCSCYMHIGKHSSTDYEYCITQTKPATPKEYADLKHELESKPYNYNLVIRRRVTRQMREKRRAAVEAYLNGETIK